MANLIMIRAREIQAPSNQRGVVLVMAAIGLLALLAMAGLALDAGHMLLNKTRLQNALDAAALSAAKTLDQTGDTVQATAAANTTLALNANMPGNNELGAKYNAGDITVTVQFSATLNPFAPGSSPARYVRVRATGFSAPSFLLQVVGFTTKTVAASAVSGPSVGAATGPGTPPVCDLVPMMVCGDPNQPNYGYQLGAVTVLKTGSKSSSDWQVGPGNFQLVDMGAGNGGSAIRTGLAGGYTGCVDSNAPIQTEPGDKVGPVVQGLNTRLGLYSGPVDSSQYPPDVVTTQNTTTIVPGSTQPSDLSYNYDKYQQDVTGGHFNNPPAPGGDGVFERRILAVPIGNCTGTTNGAGTVPLLGYGCFFLLQKVVQTGQDAQVYGQFVENCLAGITPAPAPTPPGSASVHKIILYKDADSFDS